MNKSYGKISKSNFFRTVGASTEWRDVLLVLNVRRHNSRSSFSWKQIPVMRIIYSININETNRRNDRNCPVIIIFMDQLCKLCTFVSESPRSFNSTDFWDF